MKFQNLEYKFKKISGELLVENRKKFRKSNNRKKKKRKKNK